MNAEALFSIELGERVGEAQRASRDETEPAPLEAFAQCEDFIHLLLRSGVAVARHGAHILIFDGAAALNDLPDQHQIDCMTSSGSKPEMTTGFPYSFATNS